MQMIGFLLMKGAKVSDSETAIEQIVSARMEAASEGDVRMLELLQKRYVCVVYVLVEYLHFIRLHDMFAYLLCFTLLLLQQCGH